MQRNHSDRHNAARSRAARASTKPTLDARDVQGQRDYRAQVEAFFAPAPIPAPIRRRVRA